MKLFRPSSFLILARSLELAAFKMTLPVNKLWLGRHRVGGYAERIAPDTRTRSDEIYGRLEADCIELELIASLATVRKIRSLLSQPDAEYRAFGPLAEELQGRLLDEMQGRYFFAISLRETELYRTPLKNWEQIVSRFPASISDVEEASKCFALSRFAAAVFHSLQVIETGLIELGKFIGVTDPKSGFTAVDKRLTTILATERASLTEFERDNYEFLEQIQGTVAALKNAWRNKISHVHNRLILMTTDFSPEIAEEILFASRAFMRRLVEGLPPLNEEEMSVENKRSASTKA